MYIVDLLLPIVPPFTGLISKLAPKESLESWGSTEGNPAPCALRRCSTVLLHGRHG